MSLEERMSMRRAAIFFLAYGIATGPSTYAGASQPVSCPGVWPEELPVGQPFVLSDPRSGLTLNLEKDGRHMAATNRQGKVIWHRDLFSGVNPDEVFGPPPHGFLSENEWTQRRNAEFAALSIDRIGIEPDCALSFIDQMYPPRLRGHYIRAGSGTHIFWLLDATTGDFQMEEVN
jgi:hypothetical protein